MAPTVGLLEAPVKEKERETEVEFAFKTPEEELQDLEREALKRGMHPDELKLIQAIGRCPDQVQRRIARLRRWLAEHPL